jgi:hypothetical protein
MGQLSLFSELITEPSTSVIGLQVTLPQACRCGESIAIIGPSRGPHHASIICCGCGAHRAWMSGATYNFLSTIIDQFGRPLQPIEVTLNSRTPWIIPQPQPKGDAMHVDQLYPSRFLRCSDLGGRPLVVVIADLKREDVGRENKVIVSFTGGTKALILNKVNAKAIARLHGDETRNWRGKSITLVPAQVDFRVTWSMQFAFVQHRRNNRRTTNLLRR